MFSRPSSPSQHDVDNNEFFPTSQNLYSVRVRIVVNSPGLPLIMALIALVAVHVNGHGAYPVVDCTGTSLPGILRFMPSGAAGCDIGFEAAFKSVQDSGNARGKTKPTPRLDVQPPVFILRHDPGLKIRLRPDIPSTDIGSPVPWRELKVPIGGMRLRQAIHYPPASTVIRSRR